jgi:hypothetical protein
MAKKFMSTAGWPEEKMRSNSCTLTGTAQGSLKSAIYRRSRSEALEKYLGIPGAGTKRWSGTILAVIGNKAGGDGADLPNLSIKLLRTESETGCGRAGTFRKSGDLITG